MAPPRGTRRVTARRPSGSPCRRALAIALLRIADVDAGGPQHARVARQVVGLQAVVDEPAALLQRRPPAMVVARLVEGDQLEIGAIAEGNQAVVGADARVAAAGHDGEAEVAVVLGGGVERSEE